MKEPAATAVQACNVAHRHSDFEEGDMSFLYWNITLLYFYWHSKESHQQKSPSSLDIPNLPPMRLRSFFFFALLSIGYLSIMQKSIPKLLRRPTPKHQGNAPCLFFWIEKIRCFPSRFKPWWPTGLCEIASEKIISKTSNQTDGNLVQFGGCKHSPKKQAENCMAFKISVVMYIDWMG